MSFKKTFYQKEVQCALIPVCVLCVLSPHNVEEMRGGNPASYRIGCQGVVYPRLTYLPTPNFTLETDAQCGTYYIESGQDIQVFSGLE